MVVVAMPFERVYVVGDVAADQGLCGSCGLAEDDRAREGGEQVQNVSRSYVRYDAEAYATVY